MWACAFVVIFLSCYFTVTVIICFLLPDLTVIFAVPCFLAVITPLVDTVAMFLFEDV